MKKQMLLETTLNKRVESSTAHKRQEKLASVLVDAEQSLNRVSGVVTSMTQPYGIDANAKQLCDMNDCIMNICAKLRKQGVLPVNTSLYLSDLPDIEIDESKINQVLFHLLLNASQAITKDGDIEITSHLNHGSVEISIWDNGCGIPETDLENIYDVNYTTKKSNEGIGLGLAISADFINEHFGELIAVSKQGYWSMFTIKLPIAERLLH